MSKLRSVSTAFWSDPFIEDLSPDEKLLFLYLITNEKTNMLGIYEASIKKMAFETGLSLDKVKKALKEFERLSKVKYVENYVILLNFLKHQNFNTNMKKSAIDVYNSLPKALKDKSLSISKDNPSKGFESLSKHFGMVSKVEIEVEEEVEDEVEKEISYTAETINDIYSLYPTNCPVKGKPNGKGKANKEQIKRILKSKEETVDSLKAKIERYVRECKNSNTYFKNFGTFLNNLPDYSEEEKKEELKEENLYLWIKKQLEEEPKKTFNSSYIHGLRHKEMKLTDEEFRELYKMNNVKAERLRFAK
jgi:hypothetical protein